MQRKFKVHTNPEITDYIAADLLKECKNCGVLFYPEHAKTVYCTHTCLDTHNKRAYRRRQKRKQKK